MMRSMVATVATAALALLLLAYAASRGVASAVEWNGELTA
jgi:hypothetical protein